MVATFQRHNSLRKRYCYRLPQRHCVAAKILLLYSLEINRKIERIEVEETRKSKIEILNLLFCLIFSFSKLTIASENKPKS